MKKLTFCGQTLSPAHEARRLCVDVTANVLLGISITAFAVKANFAPGGVSGLAVMVNHLFGWPIGLVTLLINLPIIAATFRRLGLRFFINSAITMLIGAVMVDWVMAGMPDPGVPRWLSSVLSGVFAGIGYALIFRIDSSTGGTDFIIVALKRSHPKWSFGRLTFFIDGSVIVLSIPVFGDWLAFVYGMVYTLFVSLALDLTTRLLDGRKAQGAS